MEDYKTSGQDTLTTKGTGYTTRICVSSRRCMPEALSLCPIDIYQAKARHFQIIDGKLMPSLSTIDGLGDKAAEAIVDAVKDGPFLSKEDFRQPYQSAARPSVDLMADLGLLGDLPECNQLSLFDFT